MQPDEPIALSLTVSLDPGPIRTSMRSADDRKATTQPPSQSQELPACRSQPPTPTVKREGVSGWEQQADSRNSNQPKTEWALETEGPGSRDTNNKQNQETETEDKTTGEHGEGERGRRRQQIEEQEEDGRNATAERDSQDATATTTQRAGRAEKTERSAKRARTGPSSGTSRATRATEQEPTDREWLTWISRFRFVTCDQLARRFGVHPKNARRRVRWLANQGWVSRHRHWICDPYLIVITNPGLREVGHRSKRSAPRPDIQQAHELAVVDLAIELEVAAAADREATIYTERDCHRLKSTGGHDYSVRTINARGRKETRWPDLVVVSERALVAVELEFSPKSTQRLSRIIEGYLVSSFTEMRFLTNSVTLARRLDDLQHRSTAHLSPESRAGLTQIALGAHRSASAADAAAIRALSSRPTPTHTR